MSVCQTEHWVLDCGAGSGCFLLEGEAGDVLYWSCSHPHVVKARRKSPEGERLISDPSQKLTLCYQDLDRSAIAETLSELAGRSIVVSGTEDAGPRTLCQTGTFYELLQANGLVLGD